MMKNLIFKLVFIQYIASVWSFTSTHPLRYKPLKNEEITMSASSGDSSFIIEDEGDEALFRQVNIVKELEASSFQGAGSPRPELNVEDIVPLLMTALKKNDFPEENSGLKSMWAFAGDTTRFVFQNNMTEFIESCHETADQWPTSFYGVAMNGQSWNIETEITRVGGENGWIATQVIKTISSDGRMRRWQWELRKNRRPPNLNAWYVETIASSDRKGDFEAKGRGTGWSD